MTKNRESRFLPLTDRVQSAIKTYFSTWTFTKSSCWPTFAFPGTRPNTHLTTRQAQRVTSFYGTAALGIPLWPHMLRHSFATRVLRSSNTRIVQQLLGHKKLSSTQIYTHPNTDDLKNAVNGMANKQGA
jgi:integrase/recombinase XerC